MTTIADFITHPTHFGDRWVEAVVTGAGALVLSIVLSGVLIKDNK